MLSVARDVRALEENRNQRCASALTATWVLTASPLRLIARNTVRIATCALLDCATFEQGRGETESIASGKLLKGNRISSSENERANLPTLENANLAAGHDPHLLLEDPY